MLFSASEFDVWSKKACSPEYNSASSTALWLPDKADTLWAYTKAPALALLETLSESHGAIIFYGGARDMDTVGVLSFPMLTFI